MAIPFDALTWQIALDALLGQYPDSALVTELKKLVANAMKAHLAAGLGAGDPWQPFTLADAYAPRPLIEYVVDGLFELPSLNIVFGSPGSLKSFLLADLAVCVAAGKPWLEPAPNARVSPKAVTQCPVVWADFDNGRRRTHERFAALGRAHSVPEDAPLTYFSMPSPLLNANSADSVGDLIDRASKLQAKLIVLDNLGVISGGVDENGSEMITVLSNLRRLTEETGAAIVIPHHPTKHYSSKGRLGDALRGHSSIEAALDLALFVEREEFSDTITVQSTKTRGLDVPPFDAIFTYTHVPGTKCLETVAFFGVETFDTKSYKAIEEAILDTVSNNPTGIKQSDLVAAVQVSLPDVGQKRLRGIANRMAANNQISATTGSRGSKLYAPIIP